ncbi:GNAT family N-acetyltransferase [Actinocorallia lasiicapitis]
MNVPETIDLDGYELRRWRPEHAASSDEAIHASFDALHAWMPWAAEPGTISDRVDFIETSRNDWEAGTAYNFGIFEGDRVVGSIGLMTRSGPGSLEIGYWLHSGWTGRGVMTKAAGTLTELALALPGVTRVEIHCDEGNKASAAIAARLGYTLACTANRTPAAASDTGRDQIWIKEREAGA